VIKQHDEMPDAAEDGTQTSSDPQRSRRSVPRPTIHDDPTIVEDGPQTPAEPAQTSDGHTYPGGLERLADRYQLQEPIAAGGAAVVWRAFDEVLSRTVAIKLLHPHLAGDPRTVERFRQESINAARLAHPNVVAIYDTGQEGDVVYLVMEHVDGPSLREILAERGALDPDQVAALGEQVAAALGEAHAQGLVHRDVKPANILLNGDGVAKVTDFGIAKALSAGESEITAPGTMVGTAAYVAPEQFAGTGGVDPRADVYALGVVLHEALTGQRAFQGDTAVATAAARTQRELLAPRQVRADVPRALDDIVVRATRIDPADRPRDGAAMAAALAPLVRQRPSETTVLLLDRHTGGPVAPPVRPGGLLEAPTKFVTGRRPLVWVLTAFAAGLIVALGLVNAFDDPGPATPPAASIEAAPSAEIFAVSDFDPHGGDRENPELAANLLDRDPATGWRTDVYPAPLRELGLPGVGVWLDLGAPSTIQRVRIDVRTPGATFELLTRSAAPGESDTEADWRQVGRVVDAGPVAEVELDDVRARWWLLWFTELASTDAGEMAEVGSVSFVEAP
jgi:serine/threonine-protein kinase